MTGRVVCGGAGRRPELHDLSGCLAEAYPSAAPCKTIPSWRTSASFRTSSASGRCRPAGWCLTESSGHQQYFHRKHIRTRRRPPRRRQRWTHLDSEAHPAGNMHCAIAFRSCISIPKASTSIGGSEETGGQWQGSAVPVLTRYLWVLCKWPTRNAYDEHQGALRGQHVPAVERWK